MISTETKMIAAMFELQVQMVANQIVIMNSLAGLSAFTMNKSALDKLTTELVATTRALNRATENMQKIIKGGPDGS